jgi:CO dehydrogenase/acetyl-CoA synthase beta subunit
VPSKEEEEEEEEEEEKKKKKKKKTTTQSKSLAISCIINNSLHRHSEIGSLNTLNLILKGP